MVRCFCKERETYSHKYRSDNMKKENNKLRKSTLVTVVSIIVIVFLLIMGFDEFFLGIAIFVLLISILLNLKFLFQRLLKKDNSTKDNLPSLSRVKEEHYSKTGMSEDEIVFFRKTMAEAKANIVTLNKNMTSTAKLKSIDLRLQTTTAAKAMFKELVNDPQKLHLADQFLYNHLPNITELTNKYLEIDRHELKTKQTYQALKQCAEAIEKASILLIGDYNKFVQDDLDELDVEISIAEKNTSHYQDEYKGE